MEPGHPSRQRGSASFYLYSQGENYWFSPIASLNQEAEDRAKALPAFEIEAEMATLVRAEERHKGSGFLRVHGAPATIHSASTTPMRPR